MGFLSEEDELGLADLNMCLSLLAAVSGLQSDLYSIGSEIITDTWQHSESQKSAT